MYSLANSRERDATLDPTLPSFLAAPGWDAADAEDETLDLTDDPTDDTVEATDFATSDCAADVIRDEVEDATREAAEPSVLLDLLATSLATPAAAPPSLVPVSTERDLIFSAAETVERTDFFLATRAFSASSFFKFSCRSLSSAISDLILVTRS